MQDSEKLLRGYCLTTAEILYHMPDHPGLLQTYLWQDYDIAPEFPVLCGFIEFWAENLDGPLHSVKVAYSDLVKAADLSHAVCPRDLSADDSVDERRWLPRQPKPPPSLASDCDFGRPGRAAGS